MVYQSGIELWHVSQKHTRKCCPLARILGNKIWLVMVLLLLLSKLCDELFSQTSVSYSSMDMTSNRNLPYIYKEKLFDVRKVVFTAHLLQKHSQASS